MRNMRAGALSILFALPLNGCATASFAPPSVELTQHRKLSNCGANPPDSLGPINPDQAGAHALTDNFIYAYRCAQREAADGRQIFQVPTFLALIVATLGPTFGASDDARIAMAGYGAALDRGNEYYAPKAKAGLLDHGIDALLCIKNEQVGVDYFDTTPDPQAAADVAFLDGQLNQLGATLNGLQRRDLAPLDIATLNQHRAQVSELEGQYVQLTALKARRAIAAITGPLMIQRQLAGGSIKIDVERQYYDMVASALLSVERVIGRRLSESGTPDSEAFAALLKKLADDAKTAKDNKDKTKPSNPSSAALFRSTAERDQAYVEYSIEALQAQLQLCILRAKMA